MKQILRGISILLVLVLVFHMLPMQIFAEQLQMDETATQTDAVKEAVAEPAHILGEVSEKRTEYSKEFLLSNGLHMAVLYPNAVHYQKDGQWAQIDNTLTAHADGTVRNAAGVWDVRLPGQTGTKQSLTISKDGYTLSFGLPQKLTALSTRAVGAEQTFTAAQAGSVAAQVDAKLDISQAKEDALHPETVIDGLSSRVTYESLHSNTNVVYDLTSNKVKESMVLRQYDPSLAGFRYALDVGTMVPVLDEAGHITFYDETQSEVIMVIAAPYMMDAEGEVSTDVQVALTGKDSSYTLTYTLPKQWLTEESRQWPVLLDPTVTDDLDVENIRDASVAENTTFSYTSPVLETGYYQGEGRQRTYLKYAELPELTPADVVVDAKITLFKFLDSDSSAPIEVHKVKAGWESETITWANKPNYNETIEDFVICQHAGYYSWNITDIVQQWYSTGVNTGMLFKASDAVENAQQNNFKQFYSSDYSNSPTCMPTLEITFRNTTGLEDYWPYTSFSAGRAGTGYVNNYCGNLVWVRPDMGIDGNRMPVTISHYYNSDDSQLNTFGMGYGWRTNYNQLVYAYEDDQYYIWEDEDGTLHFFEFEETNTYADEDGLGLTLKIVNTTNAKYTITDAFDNIKYFDTKGRLIKIENCQSTSSCIQITYTDDVNRFISTITDGAGRVYSFSYNSDDLLSRISYKGTGNTDIIYTDYLYTNNNLITIVDMDEEETTISYNGHMLTSVQDVDGYKVTIECNLYESDYAPYRVTKVQEYDGSVAGNYISLSYANNQTTLSDKLGNSMIMQFNNWGNAVSIQDDQGHAQYAVYATDQDGGTGKGNQLILSSKLQNTVSNLLEDSSFESGTLWTEEEGSASVSQSIAASGYLGNKSLQISGSNGESLHSTSFTAEAGTTYTFSGYVKTTAGSVKLGLYRNGETVAYSEPVSTSSDWTRVQVSYTNSTESTQTLSACVLCYDSATAYIDCVQVEKASTASRYNLIDNGDFRFSNHQWTAVGTTSNDGLATVSADAPQLDDNVYRLTGDFSSQKSLSQTVPVRGVAGDTFVIAGWAKGDSVPLTSQDEQDRAFGIRLVFNYTQPSESEDQAMDAEAQFNPDADSTIKWQYSAVKAVAARAYDSITVQLVYDYNANTVCFDGIQLYKEEFGTVYTYNDDGDIKGITDENGNTTSYEYTDGDLTSEITADGEETNYVYDNYHNLLRAVSDNGIIATYTYDAYGNNTSVTQTNTDDSLATTSSSTYSVDGNYLVSTTDSLGKVTTYSYDSEKGVLDWVQNPGDTEQTRTEYTYDAMLRQVAVAADTDTGLSLSANYTYTDDQLTALQTPSTTYTFTFGDFSLAESIKIGSRTLVSYGYDQYNRLNILDYGNDGMIEYVYDTNGNIIKEIYEDGATVSYRYDNDGALSTVYDSATGITTTYYYDFSGRLMKYTELGEDYSHIVSYTYTDIGNLISKTETVNGDTQTTSYSYDEQNRISAESVDGITISYTYDVFDRLQTKTVSKDGAVLQTYSLEYTDSNSATSAQVSEFHYGNNEFTCTYDDNGNIIYYGDNQSRENLWEYDSQGQLISAESSDLGYYWEWEYDNAGNILSRKKYALSDQEDPVEVVNYAYGDNEWKDLLTTYNGKTITYDAVGNMLSLGNTESFTWVHGRQLRAQAVPADIAIITQPDDCKGIKGSPASFSIEATGENLSYLWQISDDGGNTWSRSTAPTYNTNAISGFYITQGRNGRLYRCVVTDGSGNVRVSETAELVMVPIAITDQPDNFYGPSGSTVSFSLTASGSDLTYLWQVSTDGGETWNTSAAAVNNATTLTGFKATAGRNGRKYRCIITDGSGNTVTSDEVTLNTTTLAITHQPEDFWGILEDRASFSVSAYGQGLSYQWQYSSNGGETWRNSPATGNATSTLTGLTINNMRLGFLYRCMVTDENGSVVYSDTACIRLKTDTWTYTYDANGMRTQRTDGYTAYNYVYDGGSLSRMTVGDDVLTFGYDASGTPVYIQWNTVRYLYVTNLQGDIVGILDGSGNEVVTYTYDAWGNIQSVTGTLADTLGELNPLRYRGYVYDTETQLYYLQSRYYDPEIGRFINTDIPVVLGLELESLIQQNLFVYCWNNPVNLVDDEGAWPSATLKKTSNYISIKIKVPWNDIKNYYITSADILTLISIFSSLIPEPAVSKAVQIITGVSAVIAYRLANIIAEKKSGKSVQISLSFNYKINTHKKFVYIINTRYVKIGIWSKWQTAKIWNVRWAVKV